MKYLIIIMFLTSSCSGFFPFGEINASEARSNASLFSKQGAYREQARQKLSRIYSMIRYTSHKGQYTWEHSLSESVSEKWPDAVLALVMKELQRKGYDLDVTDYYTLHIRWSSVK